ncbi:DUF4328 domain-containing protein [Streptomyces sp. NPDC102259]|uniref:DUF4328 domain-containing protein n=1 Tax=Streptomyces sp. NPDC102259 TaxID=3366148 RepID=UPI003819D124
MRLRGEPGAAFTHGRRGSPGTPWGRPRPHGPVNAWWAMWIVSLLADRTGLRSYTEAGTAAEVHDAMTQVIFADLADLVAAALAIAFVLRLTGMQNEKALQGPGAVPPPPVGAFGGVGGTGGVGGVGGAGEARGFGGVG